MDTNEMLTNIEQSVNKLQQMYGTALNEKLRLTQRIRDLENANDALRQQLASYAQETA